MTDPLDDLPPLDPRATALLAAYRRGRQMPAASRDRVRARVLSAKPHEETCSSGHVVAIAERTRARGWAVALAVAAALVIWLARAGLPVGQDPDARATMSPSQAGGTSATEAQIVATPPAESPPVAASEEEVVEPPPPPERPPARPQRLEQAAPVDAIDGLREETELLSGGWRALADGELDGVARAVEAHQRRFPGGVLGPERLALAALAACADAPEQGRALASTFLAAHPRSPLARRVREQCQVAP